jgi:aryl-alcohol dehydrogenase-like predicted oxidoreductase
MPSKTTAAKVGAKGATKVVRSRTARRAAKTGARATWFVGKKVAKRKAKKHARRYRDAAGTAWSTARVYGPMAAEALGWVERPKPRRRSPAFLAGIAVGAGAMHLASRNRNR